MQLSDPSLLKMSSFINGQFLSDNSNAFDVINPATNELVAKVQNASVADTNQAVDAATAALPHWKAKTAKERANILHKWFQLIMQNQDDLAAILTAEQGKPLAEAKGEIVYGANYIEWFSEEAKRIYGDTIPSANNSSRIVVIKQPVGVVAAITPWNFPNAMITRKAAPALAAGCTFIVKASEETPLSALALGDLAQQAGIPAGVFNVIASTSSQQIGAVLTGDKRIAKFTFTGSTRVGQLLLAQCATTVKKTSMELGGNAPFIVFDDADIEQAIKGLITSKFRNAGQTCICTNRVLVQENIYDDFITQFTKAMADLEVGDGTQANVTVGPLINQKAVAGVKEKLQEAVAMGAKVHNLPEQAVDENSCFVQPCILSDVTAHMRIAQEEIFAPIAPLIKFSDEQEAIAIANDTDAGLASYVYTRDVGRVWRVSEALEYGMVGINESMISNEAAPFGGVKQSGVGREGSKYGLDDYLEIKYLCMGGI